MGLLKLVSFLLVFCFIGWVVSMVTARLLAWFLSWLVQASVEFEVAGCNLLKDISLKFRKGSIEYVSIGEIKLKLGRSVMKKRGFSVYSYPKLQLLIYDIEIVIKKSGPSNKKRISQRSKSRGKEKLLLTIANIARFLSVCITEIVVKVPKAVIEIKELRSDIHKGARADTFFNFYVHLTPLLVQMDTPGSCLDQSSDYHHTDCLVIKKEYSSIFENNFASMTCQDISIVCEFGREREKLIVRALDFSTGDISTNFNEGLFLKTKTRSESYPGTDAEGRDIQDDSTTKTTVKKFPLESVKSTILVFPEKVSFRMPKVDVSFTDRGQDLSIQNSIMGIDLSCSKSKSNEDSADEDTSHVDAKLIFNEIHLLKGGQASVIEILKLSFATTIDAPMEENKPIKVGANLKINGALCNLILSRLSPWLKLSSSGKKQMVLHEETPVKGRFKPSETKNIVWSCAVSAPGFTIVVFGLNDLPSYHGSCQSCNISVSNLTTKEIQLHTELSELSLLVDDRYQAQVKQNLLGDKIDSASLMNIKRLTIDWGQKEMQSHERDNSHNGKLVLSVDVTGMGILFSLQQIETLISIVISYKTLLKGPSPPGGKAAQSNTTYSRENTAKGTQIMKVNFDSCMIKLCGDMTVEDTVVSDPKRVNFCSQGGQVIISESADGPRTATVISNLPSGCNHVKFITSVQVVHLSLCLNTENESAQFRLERARSIYQELTEEKMGAKITLFDLKKTKFVRRSGGMPDSVRSLFSAADISARWEPDVHLALYEFAIRLKFMVSNKKSQYFNININEQSMAVKDTTPDMVIMDPMQSDKLNHKRESIFAVDVENIRLSSELADGVETLIHVSSIFSENAKIGVLLEGFMLSFNEARVLKSGRLQISSVPISTNTSIDAKVQPPNTKDWVIQGLDVHMCLPYRLQLRAIDDAVEEMFRGLKLVAASFSTVTFPSKNDISTKKSGTSKVGCLRVILRKFTADIEEEPIQGWLDEHYYMLRNEVCELNARLKFLDEVISAESSISEVTEPCTHCSDRKIHNNGVEINIADMSSVQLLRDDVYRKAFKSYYQACQKLVPSEGSGACSTGFQSGFKPSSDRASLFSISATDLDVNISKIEGGDLGMIEFIKKVDPCCLENDIPFSRLYGTNLLLNTGSLVLQLRNYTFPIFAGYSGKCKGRIVLAQQATCIQPQVQQDVFVGKWRRVRMFRSVSGTTPAMKTYLDLPISFNKGQFSFGVGYEPLFADLSYAFTVALRRANLSHSSSNPNLNFLQVTPPPKKERSLPWWDDMRYYIHGNIELFLNNFEANVLATTDPYEKQDKIQIISQELDIQQTDGQVKVSSKDFRVYLSSIHSLLKNSRLNIQCETPIPFLNCPAFSVVVTMDWECDSGNPLDHYLHALPNEGVPRENVYDPFRSLSLSLRWNFSLGVYQHQHNEHASLRIVDGLREVFSNEYSEKLERISVDSPTFNLGVHDLMWLFKWWNMVYFPPQKLRSFSRWPRFGVPRVPRSGNLSLDKVMTEFCLRIDSTPSCFKHLPLRDDDPAKGLTFRTAKLKCELCWSRGKQKYTFDCKRDILDLVYHGIDLHSLKVYLDKDILQSIQTINIMSQSAAPENINDEKCRMASDIDKNCDAGFLLYSSYFTVRRQTPKADGARLMEWQEAGREIFEMTQIKYMEGNETDSDDAQSDPSDDDEFNVVIADSCQRIFVYGLKLLWTLENRDVVWSWANGLSKAFESPKSSPSRQYAQRKLLERKKELDESEVLKSNISNTSSSMLPDATVSSLQDTGGPGKSPSPSSSPPTQEDNDSADLIEKHEQSDDTEDEGIGNFMVNIVQPQFNLHSEDANGRFLLAAASGHVLACSFHSVLHLGCEMIEMALGTDNVKAPEAVPEMAWKRVELSVMLEHVQAHVAPTDVDPGAGIQWLPKIHRCTQIVKRTGALLERVFMPCQMYFRYTRHRSMMSDFKVKPLKELSFNSPDITATMTSRQFQVMLDVLSNLLFARLPNMQKNGLSYPSEDDDDLEEEADVVIPYGIEEVELSRIKLEQVERERKLLLDNIRNLSAGCEVSFEPPVSQEIDGELWMINGKKQKLVHGLKLELGKKQSSRKTASYELRAALQKAAQLKLMEKEKNKSPSFAMRISMRINKVVWSMVEEGKSFAGVEIHDLAYDFNRDFKDIGLARFTIKSFVVRNGLSNAKSDMLLSAWNAPSEWGKSFMLRVDAKQGAPKDGRSPIELFQVDIYPLKIYLTESMYRMIWHYFFPEDEQDPQRRQEVWKVSTTAGSKRGKKGSSASETAVSSWQFTKELEASERQNATKPVKPDDPKSNIPRGPGLRRTSSFDKTWEESVAESVANELVMNANSSSNFPSKVGTHASTIEQPLDETSKRHKDAKLVKTGQQFQEEKKVGKSQDDKRARPIKLTEFHNVKISQVELLLTYEGSRFPVSDLRLLMDTFHREEFIGTWGRLFSRVKKHVIWGVLKSVTGMQGKKFKVKSPSQKDVQGSGIAASDDILRDSEGGQPGESDHLPIQFFKRTGDGAGDGFVTSIRGLFNTQRRKAKAFVLRTMRGDGEGELQGEWSEGDAEISPFARQLTITKAKKLIRRHTKKFRPKMQENSDLELPREGLPPPPKEDMPPRSNSSDDTSSIEDLIDKVLQS